MPKHYAIGENIQQYTARFEGTKTVKVDFDRVFNKVPMVQLTLGDTGNLPAYKQQVTKTSVIIQFKSIWVGDVDVLVMER